VELLGLRDLNGWRKKFEGKVCDKFNRLKNILIDKSR